MLSPGIRQVFHALLTRPPLTHKSLGFNMSPFDLHVLSTPPAFILSQDQTLMFKWSAFVAYAQKLCLILAPVKLATKKFFRLSSVVIFITFTFKGFCSLNNSICIFYRCSSLEFSGLHYCLFVKVLLISTACLICDSLFSLS